MQKNDLWRFLVFIIDSISVDPRHENDYVRITKYVANVAKTNSSKGDWLHITPIHFLYAVGQF